jgi:hypothetical protein
LPFIWFLIRLSVYPRYFAYGSKVPKVPLKGAPLEKPRHAVLALIALVRHTCRDFEWSTRWGEVIVWFSGVRLVVGRLIGACGGRKCFSFLEYVLVCVLILGGLVLFLVARRFALAIYLVSNQAQYLPEVLCLRQQSTQSAAQGGTP